MTFLQLHAGPDYHFYQKYSVTNLSIIACLLLGFCMPILYVIGIMAIIMQYFVDRLTLSYFYRLPPMYSERLTLASLDLLRWIPLFSLCCLFWLYTNKQMFGNEIDPIDYRDQIRKSHHTNFKWAELTQA